MNDNESISEVKESSLSGNVVKNSLSWNDFMPNIIFLGIFVLFVVIAIINDSAYMGVLLGNVAVFAINPYFAFLAMCIGFLVWRKSLLFILIFVLSVVCASYYFYAFSSFLASYGKPLPEGYDIFYLFNRIAFAFVAYLSIAYICNVVSILLFRKAFLERKRKMQEKKAAS